MEKKEQQVNDVQALKKAWVGNAIMLAVLTVGIILAVFAWFSDLDNQARARGMKYRTVDNINVRFNTYLGTAANDGNVVYDLSKDLNNSEHEIPDIRIFPGQTIYFKTVISNYEQYALHGTFSLESMLVNKLLVNIKSSIPIVFTSVLEGSNNQQSFELVNPMDYYVGGTLDPTFKVASSQPIFANIDLPAGTTQGESSGNETDYSNVIPSEVTIYWQIILNGAAIDNDVMYTLNEETGLKEPTQLIKFKNIRFYIENQ